ncbi:MAG: ribosome maturation factor RimM [Candidatus Ancillula sp.]|nr:ribosome maturation factor RimM [Candidatus Ancillula sp.]
MKLRVGIIGAAVGLKGEVRLRVTTDRPDLRFAVGEIFEVSTASISTTLSQDTLTLANARWHKESLIVKFEGVESREDAESLRGRELYADVTAGEEDGSYHFAELVGLNAYVGDNQVGKVSAVIPGSAQDLLEIELLEGAKVLVPFVEQIVPEVDINNSRLTLTPPPGLLNIEADAK